MNQTPYNTRVVPLVVGQQVRDGLGHWWTIIEVVQPFLYKATCNYAPGKSVHDC